MSSRRCRSQSASGWPRLFGVSEDLGTRLRAGPLAARPDGLPGPPARLEHRRVRRRALLDRCRAAHRPGTRRARSLLGAPLLAFLVLEQRVASASAQWQRRLFLELPVVSEQLGMLLSAGYSLGAALNRIAAAQQGVCGRDLDTGLQPHPPRPRPRSRRCGSGPSSPMSRPRPGLVQVLALNREAGDLGRLIAEEARAIRRDVHRELVEQIERREPAGLDPGHGRHARARNALPRRSLHRGDAPLLGLVISRRPPMENR